MKYRYLLVPLGLYAGAGLAQTPTFDELDTDGDGYLSEQELAAYRSVDFFDADTSKDGLVNPEEFRVAVTPSSE